jgi:TolB-like protein
MGEVYRAHDSRLGRDVALKILPESMAKDPEGLARFTREARAVAALNHPHIVTIFSTEEADGVRFMTMELIEGRTLDRMIPEGGVSLAQFFDVSMAIADALSAAHQKQITHRDLKPANIMVTDAGRVKVLDFGLARDGEGADSGSTSIEEQATRQKLTQAGTILGTMPYMSPEQIEARALDGRSDIFSLGIVMYEMATGGRPFRGDSSPALMSSIMREHPKSASELRPDLPGDVSRLVGRCLEKHPRDRIQSAQEILLELKALRRAWESGASTSAKPSPLADPVPVLPSTSASRARSLRIAVLPFLARSAGADTEALADGLTDDITAGLARFPYLRVVSRPDAEAVKGQAADARAGAALGARYLLDGTVRTSGGKVRISTRLVDTETGAHLWAENFDRSLSGADLFDLQDDLTSRIVATAADGYGVLVRSMAATVRERPVDESTIHELVLRYYAHFQTFHADEHRRLCAGFEKALSEEPSHALGWAMLSSLYEQEIVQALNLHADAASRRRFAADRAIEVDPSLQQGWRCLGMSSFLDRDLAGLRMAAERVQQLNPLNTSLLAYMGTFLACAGDWERGIPVVRRCMELNPQHPGWFYFPTSLDHYRRGEYEGALKQAKLANLPNLAVVTLNLAAAAGQLGRTADARSAFESLRKNHPAGLDAQTARDRWARFVWDQDLVESLVEGFEKAQALVSAEPQTQAGVSKPTSGSSAVTKAASESSAVKSPTSGRAASIAVLPFTDMSAAKDQDWFCDGVAEEILNALAGLKGLSVAARASAFSFRGKGDDLKAIGDKLNVTTVLDGSVRRAGDQLRITVRLSDVANGYQLWSERYDRSVNDIFDVQDEIAKAVAARLRVTLGDDPASLPRVIRHTESQKAYHLYLRGRHHWYSRTKDALAKSRDCFEEAIKLDPEYALAYVGLADLYTVQGIYAYAPEGEVGPKARAAVERALAINGELADAYRALGFIQIFIDWDVRAAEQTLQRAVALEPASALSYAWLGWPTWPGREEVAMPAARRAQELDPLNPYINTLVAAVHDFWDHAEEGLEHGLKALDIDSNHLVALYIVAGLYGHLGRHDEALELLHRSVRVSGRAPFFLGCLGREQASAGRAAEARETLAELDKRAASEYVSPLFPAMVHSALGEVDRAFELLEEAVRTRNGWIGCPRMRMFDGFRKDPRFVEHLRRIGHPDVPGSI